MMFWCPVGLTGTKYGCGGGGCGACTVMLSRYDPIQDTVLYLLLINSSIKPLYETNKGNVCFQLLTKSVFQLP